MTHPAPRARRTWPWWAASGAALWAVGLAVGWYATLRGASADGELHLDEVLAQHRTLLLTAVGRVFDVGAGPQVAPVLLVVAGSLLWWRRHRESALVLLGLTGAGWVSVAAAKMLIARPRPPYALVHALSLETSKDSFPSGHVAFVAALVAVLVVLARHRGRSSLPVLVLGLPAVALDGLARIYWGVHYLADVVAAPLLATGTVLMLAPLARVLAPQVVRVTPSWLGGPRRPGPRAATR